MAILHQEISTGMNTPKGFDWFIAPTDAKPVGIAWKARSLRSFHWKVIYPYQEGQLAVTVNSEKDARRMRQQQLRSIR